MDRNISLIVYPVKHIARAKAFYEELLGVEPYVDSPYYVGFRVGDMEIGLDPNGHCKGMAGPIGYFTTGDIAQRLRTLVEAGAQIQQDVTDVGGGMLIAWVRDADGNLSGLRQAPRRIG
ncbi:glyoxalase [bacterium]|nr:MAG: glyoxalase [bacterium]